jgi:uncharacterized PurR-regulated membrane protein YhhQ (DUF165 family)
MNRTTATICAVAYLGSIVFANYAIGHIGTQVATGAPHTLPVGFGLVAPSGVYVVGVTLVLRDVMQRQSGKAVTFALIVLAALLTLLISPALALASGVAFFASETVDFAVYSTVERRTFLGAVLASNAVSIVVDSALFLYLAFGSLAFLEGQVVGKAIATLVAVAVLAALRVRRQVVTA